MEYSVCARIHVYIEMYVYIENTSHFKSHTYIFPKKFYENLNNNSTVIENAIENMICTQNFFYTFLKNIINISKQ